MAMLGTNQTGPWSGSLFQYSSSSCPLRTAYLLLARFDRSNKNPTKISIGSSKNASIGSPPDPEPGPSPSPAPRIFRRNARRGRCDLRRSSYAGIDEESADTFFFCSGISPGFDGLLHIRRAYSAPPCFRPAFWHRLGFCRARSPAPARELLHLPPLQVDQRRVTPRKNWSSRQLQCRVSRPISGTRKRHCRQRHQRIRRRHRLVWQRIRGRKGGAAQVSARPVPPKNAHKDTPPPGGPGPTGGTDHEGGGNLGKNPTDQRKEDPENCVGPVDRCPINAEVPACLHVSQDASIGPFVIALNEGQNDITVNVKATPNIYIDEKALPLHPAKGMPGKVNIHYSNPNAGEITILFGNENCTTHIRQPLSDWQQ